MCMAVKGLCAVPSDPLYMQPMGSTPQHGTCPQGQATTITAYKLIAVAAWLPFNASWCRYEVLYFQLGLSRLLEYIQLGLLNPASTITMKDLQDCGCVGREIKYGVRLYGKVRVSAHGRPGRSH